MGVATANSVLVVTFANELLERYKDPYRSALEAGYVRIRPVLMTGGAHEDPDLIRAERDVERNFKQALEQLTSATPGSSEVTEALGIAVATLISAFNSLTLSPALAALLLKPRSTKKDLIARGLDLALGWFFRLFNKGFDAATNAYASAVRACCAWRQWSRWCTRGC
jgi:multidrug efflux pump subunit AcrB